MTEADPYSWHCLAPQLVAEQLSAYGPGAVVEIGVWRGELSARLLRLPALTHLTMVDPWSPVYGRDERGRWVVCGPGLNEAEMEAAYAETVNIAEHACGRATILRRPSVDAAPLVADGTLAAVIIDGLHFTDQVIEDIVTWLPKLRPDGLLIGDDFSDWFPGVKQGVETVLGSQYAVLGQTWWATPQRRSVPCCS